MKSFVKFTARLILAVAVVFVVTLAYLNLLGFPPLLRRFVQDQLRQAGLASQFGSIKLDLVRGVIARDAVLADAKAPERPLGRIDEAQLQWNWDGLWHRRNAIRALRIANATISWPSPADEIGPEQFTAKEAYATILLGEDGTIQIDQLNGVYCGIRLHITGRLKPRATAPAPAEEAPKPAAGPGPSAFVTKALRELNSLRFKEPPQLDVDFDLDLARPLDGKVKARLRGSEFGYRQLNIGTAAVDVGMRDGAIDITQCLVRIGTGELTVGGRYDIAEGRFDMHLTSTLDPSLLAPALPPAAARELAELQVTDNPKLTARYVLSPETGTLPVLQGTLQAARFSFRGVDFRAVSFAFESKGPEVKVSDAKIVMTDGQLTGRGQFHIESSDFSYDFDSTLNPRALLPILFPAAKQIVEPSWFETSPHIVASVSGDFVDPDAFAYDAELTADRCTYRGVPMTAASANLHLRHGQLAVPNLLLKRTEGELHGSLLVDFNKHQIGFDVQTTANPTEMAPLLGPKAAELMRSYRFGPRTAATARGMVDLDVPANSAWTAQADNDGFSYWKLTAGHAMANLTLTNNLLTIDGIDADLYDGKLTGRGAITITNETTYRFEFDAERCDVQKLLSSLHGKPSKVTGLLKGHCQLTGQGSDLGTLRGTGNLDVTDGILWQGPIFGPFSEVLGKTKATSAKATFTIADQAVKTDDLEIQAGVFTGFSRGKVGFDGSLDFRVEGRFLSAIPGWNLVSALLGKLLEYKVAGTISDPSYRAVNLPKELLPHD